MSADMEQQHDDCQEQQQADENLDAQIEVSTTGRYIINRTCQQPTPIRIKAHYISPLIQRAHPLRMLEEIVIGQLVPSMGTALPDWQLVWSYNQQLKPQVINARAVLAAPLSIDDVVQQLAGETCSCAQFPLQYKQQIRDKLLGQHYPSVTGTWHVKTTDLDLIGCAPLRSMLSHGLNHIPVKKATVQEVVEVNVSVAQQFFHSVVQPTAAVLGISLSPDMVHTLSDSAAVWTQYQLQQGWHDEVTDEMTDEVHAALRQLQQQLHICEVDKAANTCCLICPQYAQLLVLLRLLKTADFEQTRDSMTDIRHSLRTDLAGIHSDLAALVEGDRLPLMRIAYKAHKDEFRYLTNASGTLLSRLNSLAQDITSRLMEGVQRSLATLNKGIQSWTGSQTQSCIVIANAQNVAINMPELINMDFCADITKCFEHIPTAADHPDSLPAAFRWAIQQAFQAIQQLRGKQQVLAVTVTGTTCYVRWQNKPGNTTTVGRIYLTPLQTERLLTLVVNNAYVAAGGIILRQTTGIPMGADYSPDACNLYFMRYECAAVKRMARLAPTTAIRATLCKEWVYCFRMMDDIRMINAPTLSHFVRYPTGTGDPNSVGWIYPACVGIDVTYAIAAADSSRVQDTQYLDMLTHIFPDGTYATELYDKSVKLPLQPVKYISLSSNRPPANSYKLLLGQACRAVGICSTPQLAAKHINSMISDMSLRGFNKHRLHRVLIDWAKKNDKILGKQYSMSDVLPALSVLQYKRRQMC